MSRKLNYLNESIGRPDVSPQAKQCLLAQRAMYFARKGELDRSLADIAAINVGASSPILIVSVMRNLAEAVVDFYCYHGEKALDKSMRAYSLAVAGELIPERALSAAWLAHFFDSDHDVDRASKYAKEALTISEIEAHDTRARAGLVVAQNLGIAGRPDLAASWYASVLRHASVVGDELTISALMFNRTMEQVSCLRQSKLQFDRIGWQSSCVKAAATSAGNFDILVENHGLENLNPLLLAQVLSLRGSYQDALDIYSSQLPLDGYAFRMKADFAADHSICLLKLGRPHEARQMMELALQKLVPETHPDDRASTHSRAAILYSELGNREESTRQSRLAVMLWQEYSVIQSRMVELFSGIANEGEPT